MSEKRFTRFRMAWRSLSFRIAVRYIVFLFALALLSPIIATRQPLLVKDGDGFHFPALTEWGRGNVGLQDFKNWDDNPDAFVIHALIPYSPGESDLLNSGYKGPFDEQLTRQSNGTLTGLPIRNWHWLGTDLRGTDVLSGILYGARISLAIGLLSSICGALVGLFLGGISGWLSVTGWYIRRGKFWSTVIVLPFILHILLMNHLPGGNFFWRGLMVLLLFLVGYGMSKMVESISFFNKTFRLSIDPFITRITELFSTFPKILIVLVFAGFLKPSWLNVVILLTLTGWADMARLVRTEILRVSSFNYLDAARLSGAGTFRILWKHVLPNAVPALAVMFVFSIALNILIESSLSFLGLGVPPGTVTWGTLLASGKEQVSAWWLVLFPGLVLSCSIAALQHIAEGLQIKR
ncbi:hypothetical protein BH11BAC2_BH11BAC2_20150 [soil metagenome]